MKDRTRPPPAAAADAGPEAPVNLHCDPGTANPTAEVCDSFDNDCNGLVDDGLTMPNAAGCGSLRCYNGAWIEGTGDDVGATTETCNNHDDNCNGMVDEGLARVDPTNACRKQVCTNGVWVDEAGTGAEDGCDGVDNDCDGAVDEDFQPELCWLSCGGLPTVGTQSCAGGATQCIPNGSIWSFEICNGKDDDCDEFVDDNIPPQPCPCGVGTKICVDGNWVGDCGTGCVIGTERWCDDPVYCHWGRQACVADPDGVGRWGDCTESTSKPGDCDSVIYDPDCCVAAGECCQDAFNSWQSVGDCTSQCP